MKPTLPMIGAFVSGALCAGILGYVIFGGKPARAPQPARAAYAAPVAAPEPSQAVPSELEPRPEPVRAPAPAKRTPVKAKPAAAPVVEQAAVAAPNPAPAESTPPAEPPPVVVQQQPPPVPTVAQSVPERPQLMRPDPLEQKRARDERTAETVTLPAGTVIHVRLNQALSSERNENGDGFNATLTEPVVANGFVIAERGARVDGRIVDAARAGKVKGLARIAVRLTTLHTSDNQKVAILTDDFVQNGRSSKAMDAAKVGAGAGIGAALGAIFGGGTGAAIGAAAGGAAGGGTVLMTRGHAAELEVETKIPFRLREAVTITENR